MKKQRRRNQQEWYKWDQSSELISFWWVSGPDAVIEPDSLDFTLGVVILSKINCWFLLPRSTPDKSHDFRLKHLINWCFTKEELIHVKSSELQGPEEEERSHPGCFFPRLWLTGVRVYAPPTQRARPIMHSKPRSPDEDWRFYKYRYTCRVLSKWNVFQ